MPTLFTSYPDIPWKKDWILSSLCDHTNRLITTHHPGIVSVAGAPWSLQLAPPASSEIVRLFSDGLSIHAKSRKTPHRIEALMPESGLLTGRFENLPSPVIISDETVHKEDGFLWIKYDDDHLALLMQRDDRFSFVFGDIPKDLARIKAVETIDTPFDNFVKEATEKRRRTSELFSINPRHNPPVALATESLRQRLRNRTAAIPGIWSSAEGFETATFSLNELYPLIRAWLLIDPDIARGLMKTAFSLQQESGGFPAWINENRISSPAAPWPQMIQCFELVWQEEHDPVLLKKTLPALRKHIQWVLRHFDPHREKISTWQSSQEVFIPDNFERNKATPDLTVMLINELESLIRLCAEQDYASAAIPPLQTEHEQLVRTLTVTFWNQKNRAFSNIWKEGHILPELSFASFMPLLWKDLPAEYQKPLLEKFEETHGFPGQKDSPHRDPNQAEAASQMLAIHQFTAFEALRCSDQGRALLMMFVRRAREGFSTWFERECFEAARMMTHDAQMNHRAYSLGPITAALVLVTQQEFKYHAPSDTSFTARAKRLLHRSPFKRSDLQITLIAIVAITLAHLAYNIKSSQNEKQQLAEAVLAYKEGRYIDTINICRLYPDSPLARYLHANLLMITENPEKAEKLYYKVLLKHPESPTALIAYALSVQMNGNFDLAIRRYNDFLDIHEDRLNNIGERAFVNLAYEYMRFAEEKFTHPPKWKRLFMFSIMNDLGL